MDPHRLGLVSTRLHWFQLVARLGSIRQAARSLNVAPSSVSRILAQLEQDLGTPLFERVRQRLRLTSAGELLLYHARLSTKELNRAVTEINDLHGLRRGTVSIAVVESIARGLLPGALAEFWTRYPEITVDVRVTTSEGAGEAVGLGDSDLAIAFDVRVPPNARRLAAATLPLGALLRPGDRLAGRAELRVYDLAGERVVLSDPSLALGSSLKEALGGALASLGRRARTNSIALMVELAKRGQGVALQTRVGVEREVAEGTLVFVPIRDPKVAPRRLLLLSRTETDMSDAASALAALLTREVEGLQT